MLHRLYGLSYREFLELKIKQKLSSYKLEEILQNKNKIVDDLMEKFRPLEYWNEYLEHGYYPFYFSEQKHFLELLYNTINLTIEVDLLNLGLIKAESINKLKKLLLVICQSDHFKINISKIAAMSGLSRNSIYSYLNYLDKGGLLNIVQNSKKGLAVLAKPDKVYLNNTNQLFAICSNHKKGTVRETFFVNQVGKICIILQVPRAEILLLIVNISSKLAGKTKVLSKLRIYQTLTWQ